MDLEFFLDVFEDNPGQEEVKTEILTQEPPAKKMRLEPKEGEAAACATPWHERIRNNTTMKKLVKMRGEQQRPVVIETLCSGLDTPMHALKVRIQLEMPASGIESLKKPMSVKKSEHRTPHCRNSTENSLSL